jgi:hypothetical protein
MGSSPLISRGDEACSSANDDYVSQRKVNG